MGFEIQLRTHLSKQGRQFYSGPVATEGCIHPKGTKAVVFGHIGVSDTAWLVTCLKNEFASQKKLDVVVYTWVAPELGRQNQVGCPGFAI